MELKTDRIHLPKDLYMHFISTWVKANKDTKIVKIKGRRCVPYELHDDKGEVLLTFTRWSNIVNTFIFEARDRIVDGEALTMHQLGVIHGRRVERNFRNKHINWAETKKQPKVYNETLGREAYVRKIYHTEDDYCRIGWERRNAARTSNNQLKKFKFVPTSSNTNGKRGFKTQFSTAQFNNPRLKLKYIFYPYKLMHGTQ
jgi:hypothetical protein